MMHADSVLATAFSRDSEMLATASQDGQIKVRGNLTPTVDRGSKTVRSVQVWKLRTGQVLRRYDKAHALGVTSLRFGRDGTQLLSGSFDTTLKYVCPSSYVELCRTATHLVIQIEFMDLKVAKH